MVVQAQHADILQPQVARTLQSASLMQALSLHPHASASPAASMVTAALQPCPIAAGSLHITREACGLSIQMKWSRGCCRFFPSLEWYVDVMLTLIERAGDMATKDIWHSVVQLITNNDELHGYAAQKVCLQVYSALQSEVHVLCSQNPQLSAPELAVPGTPVHILQQRVCRAKHLQAVRWSGSKTGAERLNAAPAGCGGTAARGST